MGRWASRIKIKKEVSPVSTSPKELKRKLTIYLLIKKWNGLPWAYSIVPSFLRRDQQKTSVPLSFFCKLENIWGNNLLSGIIPKSGIALSTLHGAAIQRKTPALDWGKCLSSGGLGDFYCWRFRQEAVYLVSNLRCKGSDYFNNNINNKVNKVKTTVYLDFI